MKKTITISIIILILVGLSLFIKPRITGDTIVNKNSYTYAVCDKNKFCEDYYIECENNKLKKISPTGFAIQQPEEWQDERPPITEYCK
jgi:hypothetical protein